MATMLLAILPALPVMGAGTEVPDGGGGAGYPVPVLPGAVWVPG